MGFDYPGERAYYPQPVLSIRPYEWLEDDLKVWVPDYPHIFKGRRVLDIGAGEALVSLLVAERHGPVLLVALELILHRLWAVNTRVADVPNLAPLCGDCYYLPFRDGSFDIVIGNGVLHHLPNLPTVIGGIGRVLEEGGVYVGREPNFCNPLVKRRVLGPHRTPNEHALYTGQIAEAFRKSGFNVQIDHFWRRVPWLRNRFLAVSLKICAVKG